MTENLPDTNVGNIDYISRQAVLNLPQSITRNFIGEVVERSIDVEDVKDLPAADVVSKADMITLLEETEKDITKGVEASPAGIMCKSVFGIIKCKVNMMGEKSNE